MNIKFPKYISDFDDMEEFIFDDELEEILREEAMSGELNEYWKDIIAPHRFTFKENKNDSM